MKLYNSVALVTGANRGLGAAIAHALLERGAATVYAGVRDPATVVTRPGLVPVRLDVTDPATVAAAAERCGDVTLLVNNAGIAPFGSTLSPTATDDARAAMETNYFGPLALSRAFAPVLARNGGGTLVNVLSVLSWLSFPTTGAYSASKAAAWALTNALRLELLDRGTRVVGVHAGYIDTDMAAGVTEPKSSPEDVAAQILDAIEADRDEVLADAVSQAVRAGLAGELTALYPQLAVGSGAV
ncbi:SDR family oxidoreductase [Streptomyces litchfieldiae]|uniref:SDR family oxidoreductase n=1 Tax=Streptomyces litchfieldiae TaxID=3075543 RepID=A0ABU2MXT1_9ACTN|nr:SDR family oxidoreductase [Streptomyces sp. DSM 44938]MDT0346451.1 SDR family oxidoreductase [Streptomyces sp. DSM 44938]